MPLSKILLTKNAQFYCKKKNLSKNFIGRIFKEISSNKIGNYLLNIKNEKLTSRNHISANYSILSFKINSEPSFLDGSNIIETYYSFLLIIELDKNIIIFKKHISNLEDLMKDYIDYYDYDLLCHFQGSKSPDYEKINMKNMSISDYVVKNRTLEAKALNGILPSNSSSRSIPKTLKIKTNSDSFSLLPNTSRIIHHDYKANLEEIIEWSFNICEEIKNTSKSNAFINNFASPISLEQILKKTNFVTGLLFDNSELKEKIDKSTIQLKISGSPLSARKINQLFKYLDQTIEINQHNQSNEIYFPKRTKNKSKIILGKNLITVKSSILNSIEVHEINNPQLSLQSLINREKSFSAVFNSPNYSYFSRACFEDKGAITNIPNIIKILNDSHNFIGVKEEKSKPHSPLLTRFPADSLFRYIEDHFCKNSDLIFCDDMDDEWADHICIDITSEIPCMSFIHSKFTNKDSYGASSFHEVVSQALKNIGRTKSIKKLFIEKKLKWDKNYEKTLIPRTIKRNTNHNIEEILDIFFQNPNSITKIVLAAPFFSKSKLKTELSNIVSGSLSKPYHTQLIWLLNTFSSSCSEYGVKPEVLCKP